MLRYLSLFCWVFSSFSGSLFGFPTLYVSIFLLLLHINSFKFSFEFSRTYAISIGLFPLFVYYVLSPAFSSYVFDSLKYSLGFTISLVSVLLFNNILSNSSSFISFIHSLKSFVFCGLVSSSISFCVAEHPSFNTNFLFFHADPNQAVFISIFLALLFYLSNSFYALSTIFLFGLLSESRSFFLFMAISIVLLLAKYLYIRLSRFRFTISLYALIISFASLLIFYLSWELIQHGFIFFKAVFSSNPSLLLQDTERYLLLQSNLSLLFDRFPFPIPAGLESYQSYLTEFSQYYGVRPARAHNFYISYMAEYGILFFCLLYAIYFNIKRSFQYCYPLFIAQISLMAILCVQEFFLSPFSFILLFSNPILFNKCLNSPNLCRS